MINVIAWIGAFGSVVSNFLAAKKISFAPKLWTFATGLLLIVAIVKQDYSNIFLFFIYEILNIYMWIEWNKNK